MKDYNKIANKIREMGTFGDLYQCGSPTKHCPVNLYFQLSEPYVIGYSFYVAYNSGKWSIDYTLDTNITQRAKMIHISGITTERGMYSKVKEVIETIRKHCGVTQ